MLVERQIVKVTGVPTTGMTMTVLMRGSNRLVLDEAERSVHDALCVVRSLVSLLVVSRRYMCELFSSVAFVVLFCFVLLQHVRANTCAFTTKTVCSMHLLSFAGRGFSNGM